MNTKALAVGRFQPFHFGHQKLMEWAVNDAGYLIIGLGSSQESYTLENPFSVSERREMIEKSLRTRFRYEILEIPDVNDDKIWVPHIEKICPKFNVVYANGEHEIKLFTNAGYEVKTTPIFNKNYYSGSEIRNRMLTGRPWREFVPTGTIDVIEAVDGVGRMKRLYETYKHR